MQVVSFRSAVVEAFGARGCGGPRALPRLGRLLLGTSGGLSLPPFEPAVERGLAVANVPADLRMARARAETSPPSERLLGYLEVRGRLRSGQHVRHSNLLSVGHSELPRGQYAVAACIRSNGRSIVST